MAQKQIVVEISSVNEFFELLKNNPAIIVIKFGATWCKPCKLINPLVHKFFDGSPPDVICCDIDVDVSHDIYSYLYNKKMVRGVPVLLCYYKSNVTCIPNDSITGADVQGVNAFFTRCSSYYYENFHVKT